MDADARPVCRHAERISISAKALTVDAAGDTYQITGVDPAVALRFLSSCDGTLSIADICEKHSIPIDIASAIVASRAMPDDVKKLMLAYSGALDTR